MQFLYGGSVEGVVELGGPEGLTEVVPVLDVLDVEGGEVASLSLRGVIVLHYIIVVFDY